MKVGVQPEEVLSGRVDLQWEGVQEELLAEKWWAEVDSVREVQNLA